MSARPSGPVAVAVCGERASVRAGPRTGAVALTLGSRSGRGARRATQANRGTTAVILRSQCSKRYRARRGRTSRSASMNASEAGEDRCNGLTA